MFSKEGIFLRFNYEFKMYCVEQYKSGIYPDTPDGISQQCFRSKVRQWKRLLDAHGPDALKHRNAMRKLSPEEKLELVLRVIEGESNQSVAISASIHESVLARWVKKYKICGYNGLIHQKKGHNPKSADMKKIGTRKPPKPNESEYEELIRLRAENTYIKAEIEVIKKEIALREEKEAARLKAKKQRLSKNSAKKDTN